MPVEDRFAAIRPYHDHEVPRVIAALLDNREFIHAITRLRFAWLPESIVGWLRPVVSCVLRRQARRIRSVADFQKIVERYMSLMIDSTVTDLTVSGLENLSPDCAYLFIGNHRDIALDAAFVNYALFHHGQGTVRIAIGDNLLTRDYVSDLMRLNKSFVVGRSARGPRQQFAVYRELSEYIHHSIVNEHHSIWIAQREGRAKDGWDRTEPAIIKMLSIAKPKELSLAEHIRALRVVPVVISYEWDPCDIAKAHELCLRASTGNYAKGEQEDVSSIARSITSRKGTIHVAFGSALQDEFATPEAVAEEIDRQILGMYRMHPSNIVAYRLLHGVLPPGFEDAVGMPETEAELERRLASMPEAERPFLLTMYANPLVNRDAPPAPAETA